MLFVISGTPPHFLSRCHIKADIYDFNKELRRLADSCDKLDASERKLIKSEKKLVATEENLQGTRMLYKEENEKQQRMQMKHKEYEDKLTANGEEYTGRNICNVIACVYAWLLFSVCEMCLYFYV
eukprot:GHVR01044503.1.p1 GENE.GHVR01044503.1~~GHVR01044503.1.p1  ORF type:complete len:125 (+),score=17.49 GHVR01044503.1:32-406(+)